MKNIDNFRKIEEFKRISREFNQLEAMPVLYGSLGLSAICNHELVTDDIDILIDDHIFKSKLEAIHSIMNSLGYVLIDPDENEFTNGHFKVGIATDGDMDEFSGIDPKALQIKHDVCQYRVLNLDQYLAVYEASSLDGYRKQSHKKDDASKIELIKSQLYR
jgi:hypothetical protein